MGRSLGELRSGRCLSAAFVRIVGFLFILVASAAIGTASHACAGQSGQSDRRPYLFVGDSITEAGHPWGIRMGRDESAAVLRARGGAKTYVLAEVVQGAPAAECISIMSGTNDTDGTRKEDYVAEYKKLLDRLNGRKIVVTLIPPQKNELGNARARELNDAILPELRRRNIKTIDLFPLLARGGVIEDRYTTDGVHFTEAAYAVWVQQLKKAFGDRE